MAYTGCAALGPERSFACEGVSPGRGPVCQRPVVSLRRPGKRTGCRAYIKECVNVKPADVCRFPETCALCLWRRPGGHQDPLTIKEWVRVFKGREDPRGAVFTASAVRVPSLPRPR